MNKNINSLNILLSSISIALANTKTYHWLIKGSDFFVLHEKFEELYTFYSDHQDKVAERILALESIPYVGYTTYIQNSLVKESHNNLRDEKKILEDILSTFDIIIAQATKVKGESILSKDDETDNYMQELIYDIQKLNWQYGAQLGIN
jgi:starvation-inducible DNA-binding protein